MTSQINPNNINGAYPVAGQDNNSQGFRTNFTNTITNFEYAAQEITALQNNTVLSASLTNSGQAANNDLNQSTLFNGISYQMTQRLVPLGTITTSATVDYTAGSYFTLTTGGSIAVSFSNLPASNFGSWTVEIAVANTAHQITFPASVTLNDQGITGWNSSTNIVTFAATGTYVFQFSTTNGGTNVTVNQLNQSLQPFNASSESVVSGSPTSLSLTTGYFTTSGTTTLAAGVSGQIKTFMQTASVATMVVTVTNAGWKASGTGTITFPGTTIGSACTLQYVNSKWYCIGNNGCTFG
jgi:hypothetical protein